MSSARYVFICEDGQVFGTMDEPTAADLEQAEVGIVTILCLADGRYYGRAGKWLMIPAGGLGSADVDGEATPPFHAPASYFENVVNRS